MIQSVIKYIILVPIFVLKIFSTGIFAQMNIPTYDAKWVHFGITLALNSSEFKIERDAALYKSDTLFVIESTARKGINLGIISDLRLSDHFNFRFIPSLVFPRRELEYTLVKNNFVTQEIESTVIEFPFHFKFKSVRLNNFRIFVISGAKYGIDLIAQYNVDIERETKYKVKLTPHQISYEYGVGFDYYFPMFKFSIELKRANGVNNILHPENHIYSKLIGKLFSQVMFLSFHFE